MGMPNVRQRPPSPPPHCSDFLNVFLNRLAEKLFLMCAQRSSLKFAFRISLSLAVTRLLDLILKQDPSITTHLASKEMTLHLIRELM